MFSTISTVLFLSSTILAQSCSRQYTVQSGDVCDAISAAQNTSTYQLAYSNQDTINECCTNLQVGQVVCLAVASQPDCTSTYVVATGDTCDAIAQNFNTNATMIGINNPQLDESCDIYPGQVLCVADSVTASPLVAGSKWVAPQPCYDDSSPSVYTPLASGSSNSGSTSSSSSSSGSGSSGPAADPNGSSASSSGSTTTSSGGSTSTVTPAASAENTATSNNPGSSSENTTTGDGSEDDEDCDEDDDEGSDNAGEENDDDDDCDEEDDN